MRERQREHALLEVRILRILVELGAVELGGERRRGELELVPCQLHLRRNRSLRVQFDREVGADRPILRRREHQRLVVAPQPLAGVRGRQRHALRRLAHQRDRRDRAGEAQAQRRDVRWGLGVVRGVGRNKLCSHRVRIDHFGALPPPQGQQQQQRDRQRAAPPAARLRLHAVAEGRHPRRGLPIDVAQRRTPRVARARRPCGRRTRASRLGLLVVFRRSRRGSGVVRRAHHVPASLVSVPARRRLKPESPFNSRGSIAHRVCMLPTRNAARGGPG